jgi:hypothetical protein
MAEGYSGRRSLLLMSRDSLPCIVVSSPPSKGRIYRETVRAEHNCVPTVDGEEFCELTPEHKPSSENCGERNRPAAEALVAHSYHIRSVPGGLSANRRLSRNGLRGHQWRSPRSRLLARNHFRFVRRSCWIMASIEILADGRRAYTTSIKNLRIRAFFRIIEVLEDVAPHRSINRTAAAR